LIETEERAFHWHGRNRFGVLTAAERLDAETMPAGRGVTIAFLDSGFVPHPDLTEPKNRILAFHDATAPDGAASRTAAPPQPADWHGTQTSVVAAGNGHLSDGLYRGLAHEARVVLIKVGEAGRIRDSHIACGLEWILEHAEAFGIRVVSISLGGDEDAPLRASRVNQLAEKAVRRGLVVVVAAGNAGCSSMHRPVPPATAPSVITVGGYDDGNDPTGRILSLYCSSFGTTADGLAKPEIIAPAQGVAAPILSGTSAARRALALSRLAAAPDVLIRKTLAELAVEDRDLAALEASTPAETRARIEEILRREKIIAAHYQHVEGTSFAAPIVASVVAQMLEVNPRLTPAAVKHILVTTADTLSSAPAVRQGHGILRARRAVEAARREAHTDAIAFAGPRVEKGRIVLTYHDDRAGRVALVGDFNGWRPGAALYARKKDGTWRYETDALPPGRYRYRLLVDEVRWIEDPSNGVKEANPYGGFDSVLEIRDQ
jgi:serine protease AprX